MRFANEVHSVEVIKKLCSKCTTTTKNIVPLSINILTLFLGSNLKFKKYFGNKKLYQN